MHSLRKNYMSLWILLKALLLLLKNMCLWGSGLDLIKGIAITIKEYVFMGEWAASSSTF